MSGLPSWGLFGQGMHGFVLDEMELGTRAAAYLDAEQAGELPFDPEPEAAA